MPIGRDFRFTQKEVQDNEALEKKLNILCDVIKELQRKTGLSSELPVKDDAGDDLENDPARDDEGSPENGDDDDDDDDDEDDEEDEEEED